MKTFSNLKLTAEKMFQLRLTALLRMTSFSSLRAVFVAFSMLSMLSIPAKTHAAVLEAKFLSEKIKKDVVEQIKTNNDATIKNIKVDAINLPFESLNVPNTDINNIKIESKINSRFFNPVTIVRVNIMAGKDVYKTFICQAKVRVYDNVWVASDFMKRGETLTRVILKEIDTTYAASKVLAGKDFDPYKHRAKKNYKPGDPIDMNFVENPPAIAKDSPVSVVFKTPSVSVTISATALDKGNIGDYIKVRSKNYKKDYVGKIIGENTVLVYI